MRRSLPCLPQVTELIESRLARQRHRYSRASPTSRWIDQLCRGKSDELCIVLTIGRGLRIDRFGLAELEPVASNVKCKAPEAPAGESAAEGGQELPILLGGSIRLHA